MRTLSLNGQWKMRRVGDERYIDAVVPGTVCDNLIRAGLIDEPCYRDNELKTFELFRDDYEYVRTVTADAQLLTCDRVILRCEGLDTLCHVLLNGREIAYADNMHAIWEWNVKDSLTEGDNELRLVFDSPVEYAEQHYFEHPLKSSTDTWPGYSYLRKSLCMFGWDWGPRVPDAGIWRDIELLGISGGRLPNMLIRQHHRNDGTVLLSVEPETEMTRSGASTSVEITVTAPDGTVYTAPGGEFLIEQPELWWPSGYGKQPLYTVTATLFVDGKPADSCSKRVGLRTMTVSHAKDKWGEEFCHVVNGIKIFAMGGDYIPEDCVYTRMTPERTRRLLEDAKLANFNTVRVWGGGIYPADWFFDICDELGLLVFQDFMFACSAYILTDEFERSIRKEFVDNIKRIRHHASLAVICGNNEMEDQLYGYIKQWVAGTADPKVTTPRVFADYIKIFEYILPKYVKNLAPETAYWPSSPSCGGSFEDANNDSRGDTHYWDVWHADKPFTDYRKHYFRYASEFGFQSFPCLATVEAFTLPEDRNVFSEVMERHQRNNSANGRILSYISKTYLYPDSFDNLLYCSQLVQADAIRYGVEHWRRNRGRCMGAVIWQLNDIWPVASWSSIDYYGRWKALHYAAKRFYAPVMLSACEHGEIERERNINDWSLEQFTSSVELCLSNETMTDVTGEVMWALKRADGTVVREGRETVSCDALSSRWMKKIDLGPIDETQHYFTFAFIANGKNISSGITLFCAPKHFSFRDPQLSVSSEGDTVTVKAESFAKYVCIESADPDLVLEDNFFDMEKGERSVRIVRGSAKDLRVRSVYDIARL